MDSLFLAVLALDLRPLAPEIGNYATSGPEVTDRIGIIPPGKDFVDPGLHRYHAARHVIALWLEPDADTRARMWTALLIEKPWRFASQSTIAGCLRDRCRAAIAAAAPEIRQRLTAKARTAAATVPDLSEWLAD